MRKLVLSAPGKVILHGEHAVVYGKTALAAGLDLRTTLTFFEEPACDNVTLSLPDIDFSVSWSVAALENKFSGRGNSEELIKELRHFCGLTVDAEPKQLAPVAFLYLYIGIQADSNSWMSGNFRLCSDLPVGAGLGSSAAFAVCVSAALLQLSTAPPAWTLEHRERVNHWALQSERIMHGTPSGIDNSISTFGSAISFRSGKIQQISMPQLRILLVDTRVPRSTRTLVAGVRARRDKYPGIFEPILDSMDALSQEAQYLLQCGHGQSEDHVVEYQMKLGDLIDMNQHLLNCLGVGHASVNDVCTQCARHGLSCKLTGAGGGGCCWALLPSGFDECTLSTLREELDACGYRTWVTCVGASGLCLHECTQNGVSEA